VALGEHSAAARVARAAAGAGAQHVAAGLVPVPHRWPGGLRALSFPARAAFVHDGCGVVVVVAGQGWGQWYLTDRLHTRA